MHNILFWRSSLLAGVLMASPAAVGDTHTSNQTPTAATDVVELIVTGERRAIIRLNNKRVVLSLDAPGANNTGDTPVTLLEVSSERAVVSVGGVQYTLTPNSVAAPVFKEPGGGDSADKKLTLWGDSRGFFFADGKVNNRAVRFLVDTGANTVTFSGDQADQIGLNYASGSDGFARTASGVAPVKSLKVKEISIQHIKLYNVSVTVVPGAFPDVPLLGGSFLNQLDMQRSGNKMELSKRSQ